MYKNWAFVARLNTPQTRYIVAFDTIEQKYIIREIDVFKRTYKMLDAIKTVEFPINFEIHKLMDKIAAKHGIGPSAIGSLHVN